MLQTIVPESSSISALRAKVEFFNGSTSVLTCTCDGALQDFSLYREGDTSKFFGFGVSHKATISLIDINRDLPAIEKGYRLEISLGNGTIFDEPFPSLYVAEITREEKSNDITCTVVDVIQAASSISVSDLNLTAPYTLADVANRCATLLGLTIGNLDDAFNLSFPEGANFSGDENLRDILNAIAEVTQTIYYINNENKLIFKRLDKSGDPVLIITKENYFELTTQTTRTLSNIYHTTELGDNLYTGDDSGTDQYIRENPFWTNRTDLGSLLDAAISRVAGTSITQFDCEWDGNYLLEIGDKIGLVIENNEIVHSYVLDDVIEFKGYLNQMTAWEFTQDDNDTAANPNTIGEKINQTFARVDKINKEINLLAQATTENSSEIASLKLTTDDIVLRVEAVENQEFDLDISDDENFIALSKRVGALEISDTEIKASVSNVETTLSKDIDDSISELESALKDEIQAGDNALNEEIISTKERVSSLELSDIGINAKVSAIETNTSNKVDFLSNEIESLTNEVNLKISSEDVSIAISESLSNGVDKVVTSTKKYTFDDEGLEISSSDSEISTTITENGMAIKKSEQEVLVANNEGVKAEDLHATTYLIIGENSRLEDWQNKYTACFWIGGNN